MLFLPECFSFIGAQQEESLGIAEPVDGPTMQRYAALARCYPFVEIGIQFHSTYDTSGMLVLVF